MTNQVETSTFPGVYQWETTDPVLGGLGGLANTPLLQLTARTKWLYDQNAGVQLELPLLATLNSPALTGTPTAPTPAADASGNQVATAGFVRGIAGGVLPLTIGANYYLSLAQSGYGVLNIGGVLTADTYLLFPNVGGKWIVGNFTSGGFALLCRNAEGGAVVPVTNGRKKGVWTDGNNFVDAHDDYNGISLTGVPTTSVPPDDDNSTQIPTTSWVDRALGESVGGEAQARATGISNEAVARDAADQAIYTDLANYTKFTDFAVGDGYQRLASGLIVQWGQHNSTTGYADYVSFPIAFPNQCLSIVVSEGDAPGWGNPPSPTIYGTTLVDKSSFQISACASDGNGAFSYRAGVNAKWIAIGN